MLCPHALPAPPLLPPALLTPSLQHPESWNPLWSVSTILAGLFSFMVENGQTYGSIETTTRQKEQFARDSMYFNVKDKMFCELFPERVAAHKEKVALLGAQGGGGAGSGGGGGALSRGGGAGGDDTGEGVGGSWLYVVILAAVVAVLSSYTFSYD